MGIMKLLPLVFSACMLAAAEPAPGPQPSPLVKSGLLDGVVDSTKASDEVLDGGSSIGLIPIASPSAQKILTQYFQGFFRDDAAKFPNRIPPSAEKAIARINEIKGAGATHLVALFHDSGGETEYVRLTAIGNFSADMLTRLESAGLGRRGHEGSFDMLAFKDAKEVSLASGLPTLPIQRISQMAVQLAKDTDCSVEIVPLSRKDAAESFNEALLDAFTEEGQPAAQAVVPARARQLAGVFPQLSKLGASHVMVIAFQNPKGADIALILAKGAFAPENQAKAKAELGARNTTETTLTLARFVDGEEHAPGEPGLPSEKKGERRFKK